METVLQLNCSRAPAEYQEVGSEAFKKMAEMLCRECGKQCRSFLMTRDMDEYHAHTGPKIGWAVVGDTILLRLANCPQIDRVDEITQLLELYDLTVVRTQLIH